MRSKLLVCGSRVDFVYNCRLIRQCKLLVCGGRVDFVHNCRLVRHSVSYWSMEAGLT